MINSPMAKTPISAKSNRYWNDADIYLKLQKILDPENGVTEAAISAHLLDSSDGNSNIIESETLKEDVLKAIVNRRFRNLKNRLTILLARINAV